jgi:uncharacterized membrane protein (UPF0127 family)
MEEGFIHIANNIFPTLLAISFEEQAQGLMGQEWPPPIMSFIYTQAQVNRFWMKNTVSPLDILFCHQGRIKQICFGQPNSTAMIGDHQLSDLVIELPFGTSAASGIKLEHKVGLVKPTQDELKKIIAKKYLGIVKI